MTDITPTNHETSATTWRVRVRCEGLAGSFTQGVDLVESQTPPQHGQRYRGAMGWHTIQSRRPTRIPAGLSRAEGLAWGKQE